jgi:hypothetical protein
MPYERRGKCVYNKETGKKMGCYKSITKANSQMRTFYAAEGGYIEEEKKKPSDAVLDRSEDIYQAMKATNLKSFVKKYGKEAENVMRGAAMKRAKDQVMTTNEEKLKEIVKKRLSTKPTKQMEEGKVGKFLTGAALFTALLAGDKMITDTNPQMKKLKNAYEKAEKAGDKEAMKKIEDMITKQEIFLSTGQGEPQNVNEEEIIYEEAEEDYEGEMAKAELYHIVENIKDLIDIIDDDTQLEAWIQSKITKAADYLNSVTQYLKYQQTQEQPVFEKTEYYLKK